MQVNTETYITLLLNPPERDKLVDLLDKLPARHSEENRVSLTQSEVELIDEIMSEIRYI